MRSFRERPLTWLFWIATICLTAVGVFAANEVNWLSILLSGQLFVLCGWAAISRAHRLARGATLVLVPLWITAVVLRYQKTPDMTEVRTVLGTVILMGGLQFVVTALSANLVRRLPGQRPDVKANRWQISIAELLGWTIVVAILSWEASKSLLPAWQHVATPIQTILSVIPAGLMISLFLVPNPRHDRVSTAIVAVAITAYFFSYSGWAYSRGINGIAAVFAYVGLWILVVRLDEQAAAPRPEGPSCDSPGRRPG